MQQNNIQEDEIYFRELFQILWEKKLFIIVFTFLVTICTIIYVSSKKPIYEVKSVIEIGSFSNSNSNSNSNNYIENPSNLIKKIEIINIDNVEKKQVGANISSVSLVKSTPNLIEIISQADSNNNASSLLNSIIKNLIDEHNKLINNYKLLILENINNLKAQKDLLENDENKFDGSLALKFDLISKIKFLELSISSYNIQETKQIGSFIKNNKPINKPYKKLIATSFVAGFILSVFLVFLMQFIKSFKEEEK